MCEIMEEFRAHCRSEGVEQGAAWRERRGEQRGMENGEHRGEKRGKAQGSFNRLRDMTKRIMSPMGKTLEGAMRYLQLTDAEKHRVRQAI